MLTVKGRGYLEAGLGLEGGEGAREPGGIEEGGDGGDHCGPSTRGRYRFRPEGMLGTDSGQKGHG